MRKLSMELGTASQQDELCFAVFPVFLMLKRRPIFAVCFDRSSMLFKHNFTRLQGLASSAKMKAADNLDQASSSLKRTCRFKRLIKISWSNSLLWMTETLSSFSLVDSFPVRTRVCVVELPDRVGRRL